MIGKKLIKHYHEVYDNSSGVGPESWRDPIFCIYQAFTEKKIQSMDEDKINDLYELAETIRNVLY